MTEALVVYVVIAAMFSFVVKGFVSKGLIAEQKLIQKNTVMRKTC